MIPDCGLPGMEALRRNQPTFLAISCQPSRREVPVSAAYSARGGRTTDGNPGYLGEQLLCESGREDRQPECHIVRGLLEGTAKVVFKKDYECKEVKCLSKGDAFCEFLVAARTKA
jgi:hypothetical protein